MITINDAIQNNSPKSLDAKYLFNGITSYSSLSQVNTKILSVYRSIGLTVNINNVEYWYASGITDNNLVPKFPGQIQSDWNQSLSTALDYIKNKPTFANIAFTGSYTDLSNTPLPLNLIAGTGVTITGSYPNITITAPGSGSGTVTSVAMTVPTGLTISGSPVTTSGTLAITTTLNGPVRGTGSGFTTGAISLTAEVSGILTKPNGGTGTATPALVAGTNITITGTWPNNTINSSAGGGTVTSVQLAVPSAFSVSGGPITGAGTITIAATGTTAQYIRGDGSLATLPAGGSVSSVNLTMPSGFTVTGSPITSTGTLAVGTTLNGNLRGNGSGFVVGNVSLTSEVTGILPIVNGGNGTSTPTLTAGTNISLSGSWPNYTINNTQAISLTSTQIGFGSGSNLLTSAASLVYNSSQKVVSVGSSVSTDMAGFTAVNDVSGNLSMFVGGSSASYSDIAGIQTTATNGLIFLSSAGTGTIRINQSGNITIFGLATALTPPTTTGTTKMLVVDVNGLVSTATIPGGGGGGTVTSVGVSMPSAFTVSGSPITSSGTIAVTGAGSTSQYIRGDGTLNSFPAIPAQVNLSAGANISITGSYPNLTVTGATPTGFILDQFSVDQPANFKIGGQGQAHNTTWIGYVSALQGLVEATLNGNSFTAGAFSGGAYSFNKGTIAGNTTVPNSAAFGGGYSVLNLTSTANGTFTITQGTQPEYIRTASAFLAQVNYSKYANTIASAITHVAAIHVLSPYQDDNPVSQTWLTTTNYYGLLIGDQTEHVRGGPGAAVFTNKWALYQSGPSDLNYLAGDTTFNKLAGSGDRPVYADSTGKLKIGTLPASPILVTYGDLVSTTTTSTLASYTTPNDGVIRSYEAQLYVNVNTLSGSLNAQVQYTNESGTSTAMTYFPQGATSAGLATGANALPSITLRASPNTTISIVVIKVSGSANYNASASLLKIR